MKQIFLKDVKPEDVRYKEISYTLSKDSFNALLGEKKNINDVFKAINETYGLLGTVTEIKVKD
mgnify:CR=1 FL=1